MNGNNAGPKVAIGCGALLLFLAFCVSAFGAFHVFVNRGGHVSADEAMPALVGGVLCMFVDFLIVVGGIVAVMRGGASPPAVAATGTQVMSGNALPGTPPASAGTPWHLIGGCGTLFFVATLCLSLSGAGYFYSEADRWESNLALDQSDDPYGGYGGGSNPMIIAIDQNAIEENQTYAGLSSCCCLFSFLLACAAAGGTIRAVQLRRRSLG